jgi:hypothetical protein
VVERVASDGGADVALGVVEAESLEAASEHLEDHGILTSSERLEGAVLPPTALAQTVPGLPLLILGGRLLLIELSP